MNDYWNKEFTSAGCPTDYLLKIWELVEDKQITIQQVRQLIIDNKAKSLDDLPRPVVERFLRQNPLYRDLRAKYISIKQLRRQIDIED
jgi:hypothetical protein